MRERLTDALRAGSAEYVDIRIEDEVSSSIVFRGEELDHIGSSKTLGGIVRALVKGGWGYATFNDLNDLDERVRQACEAARLVGTGESHFAPVEPVVDTCEATLVKDFREIPLAHKKAVVEEYNGWSWATIPTSRPAWWPTGISSSISGSPVPRAPTSRTSSPTPTCTSWSPPEMATWCRWPKCIAAGAIRAIMESDFTSASAAATASIGSKSAGPAATSRC